MKPHLILQCIVAPSFAQQYFSQSELELELKLKLKLEPEPELEPRLELLKWALELES